MEAPNIRFQSELNQLAREGLGFASCVVLFFAPGGRPGLPGGNGRPRIFLGATGSLVSETI